MFPFDRRGPGFLLLLLSVIAFLASIYLAIYSFFCTRYIWNEIPTVPLRLLMYVVGYAPVLILALAYTPPILSLHTLVTHVEQLKDGRYLAMFHDDGRFIREGSQQTSPVTFTMYKTFSDDGGLTWSTPESVWCNS